MLMKNASELKNAAEWAKDQINRNIAILEQFEAKGNFVGMANRKIAVDNLIVMVDFIEKYLKTVGE